MGSIDYAQLLPQQPEMDLAAWLEKTDAFKEKRIAWATTVGRVEPPDCTPRLALLCWRVKKLSDAHFETEPYEGYVVEERKLVRLAGWTSICYGVRRLLHRWEQRKRYADCYGETDYIFPWDPALLEGTTAENSRLDVYLRAGGKYPVSWLALWRKRPAAENLVVQGLTGLVDEMLGDEKACNVGYTGSTMPLGIPKLNGIDWAQRRPAKMLGLTRDELKALQAAGLTASFLESYKLVRSNGIPVPLDGEAPGQLKRVNLYSVRAMLDDGEYRNFWRILRYLDKQNESWHTLSDYWVMAAREGRNLEEGLVRWPRDLHAAHQRKIEARRTAEQEKAAADRRRQMQKRAKAFAARAEALARFRYEADGLLIRPCADEKELIAEGNALHHCVAMYAENIAKGKTAIFFIRRVEAPDEPFFTLELDEKNLVVRQNRGLRNCGRTPEVTGFEEQWLGWLRTQVAGDRKKEAAA